MENPYSPPVSSFAEDATKAMPQFYGGIRRLPYLGIMIGLAIVQNVLLAAVSPDNSTGAGTQMAGRFVQFFVPLFPIDSTIAGMLVGLLSRVVSLIPVFYRLKNIGMNPWGCLLMLVGLVNLLVAIRCLVLQEGYVDTKKHDTAAKVITCIGVGLIILLIVARSSR